MRTILFLACLAGAFGVLAATGMATPVAGGLAWPVGIAAYFGITRGWERWQRERWARAHESDGR